MNDAQIQRLAIRRLEQWADGFPPTDPSYTAGNSQFADDVLALLRNRDDLHLLLKTIRTLTNPIVPEDER
jgi:hypothetical protein